MGAVAGRGNSVLCGGKVRRGGQDFKPTVAWRKPVKLSGKWVGEFRWEDLVAQAKDGVFDGSRRNNLSTCHCSIAKAQAKSKTYLVPVD